MAIRNLAVCYEKGEGVKADTKQAIKLYKQAAEKGDPTAR